MGEKGHRYLKKRRGAFDHPRDLLKDLKDLAWKYIGPVREEGSLKEGLERLAISRNEDREGLSGYGGRPFSEKRSGECVPSHQGDLERQSAANGEQGLLLP